MIMTYDDSVKELVKIRLKTMPADLTLSIGGFGDYTPDQLVEHVENRTSVGEATVNMQLLFIRKMSTLSERIARAKAANIE